jgi:hypothetical protein
MTYGSTKNEAVARRVGSIMLTEARILPIPAASRAVSADTPIQKDS